MAHEEQGQYKKHPISKKTKMHEKVSENNYFQHTDRLDNPM